MEFVSEKEPKPLREAKKSALRDLQSLEEDANFKAQKVQFLLDATLGLINLAQNDIIKLFSVLAVIFMPPTLIAFIYGMNFKNMPELDATWGYPLALAAMVCAAAGPYLFFRWKRWFLTRRRAGRQEPSAPSTWPDFRSARRLSQFPLRSQQANSRVDPPTGSAARIAGRPCSTAR